MSVINRMLRDLDKRQQQERQTSSSPAAAAPAPFPWGWVLGAVVITAIAITAVMVIWQANTRSIQTAAEPAKPAPVVERPQATPSNSQPDVVVEPTTVAQATQPQQRMTPQPVVQAQEPKQQETKQSPADSPAESATSNTASTADETQGTMQVERVELSAAELAEVKLKQAREAMRKGERERAGSLFEQVIALAPEHVTARSELAAYWYGRGQIASALAVLEQGLALNPEQSRWQLLYAKILLEGGAYKQVVEALTTINNASPEASDLLQLRAAANNELGNFAAAAADYGTLAERTREGRWWLAAAVAFEDAQQTQAASRAYQQAIASTNLTVDAQRYAQQRLQILGDM